MTLAQESDSFLITNKDLRLTIRKSPAPHIAQLLHTRSGVGVISNPSDPSLFSIVFRKDDATPDHLGSAAAKETHVEGKTADGCTAVMMTFSGFPGHDLRVVVRGLIDPGNPLTLWSIEVTNNSPRKISYVRFPILNALPEIGNPDDDFIVLPYLPGALIENPAKNWSVNQGAAVRYPGDMAAQFLTYQDRTAGVYLAGMDTHGHPKALSISRCRDYFCIAHDFRLDGNEGAKWSSPYPVAIGVTDGAWWNSADRYKAWAVKQPWCAKRLSERDDVPAWWKDGPLVHVCEVRTYNAKRICDGSYYPKLRDHLRYLQGQVEGGIVAMLAGWENHRRWTAGDYFPIFDSRHAVPTIADIRNDGVRPFFYLSGLFYTFENEGVDGSKIPAADSFLPHYVVDEKTGKPQVFSLNESGATSTWKRNSYSFCVSDPFTRSFFRGVIDKAHELGVDVLQMDQTVSGAGLPCWSTQHSHRPGYGTYQTKAFCDLLADIRDYGKKKNRDFVLFHEEPHEDLIPFLDGFHMREYFEKRWYRSSPGAIGIPLFSYLYHEYIIGYGGDSAGANKSRSPSAIRTHAVNLFTGKTPGIAVWSSPQAVAEAHPDQMKMIRNHCLLLQTRAKHYLMLGRMLHPYELSCPPITYRVWVGQGRKEEEFHGPSVLTSSWQAPDGSVGHLFVNVSETPQPIRTQVDTRNAPDLKPCNAFLYRSEQGADFAPLWQAIELPKEFTAEIAPLEVVCIDLRGQK